MIADQESCKNEVHMGQPHTWPHSHMLENQGIKAPLIKFLRFEIDMIKFFVCFTNSWPVPLNAYVTFLGHVSDLRKTLVWIRQP